MQKITKVEPSVDVIIPNYNKENFVDETINSVINQTYKNWHIYIIDDHSTDSSLDKINKNIKLKNINIISLKKNKGPSFCRNYAMRISKSKYISFIDSDDIWTGDKLKKQIHFMEGNNFTFTYTDYTPFFEKDGKKEIKKTTSISECFNFKTFIRNSSINTSTMIISRSILSNHRFTKIKLLEDYLFKCKLFRSNYVARKLGKDLAFYRILEKSRSSHRLKNIFWLWHINSKFNKLNFFNNFISIFLISLNSIKKYGIK